MPRTRRSLLFLWTCGEERGLIGSDYYVRNPTKPLESKLYLRYDCFTQTMYALCLREPADPIVAYPLPQQNWIAINSQANKVVSGLDQPADATPPVVLVEVRQRGGPRRGGEAREPGREPSP